ncbi:unnamed protein product [Durusdinium trenchii]|uniref:Uncharacterized protein n=1 Tax=Durusdinium trenchii TaxID=1381693 RepID=A0ABP0K845_9DINO
MEVLEEELKSKFQALLEAKELEEQKAKEALKAAYVQRLEAQEQQHVQQMEEMERKWQRSFDKKCQVLLDSIKDASQVWEEVKLDGEVPKAETGDRFMNETSLSLFPAVCVKVDGPSLTLASLDRETLQRATRHFYANGLDLPSFGRVYAEAQQTAGIFPCLLDAAAGRPTFPEPLLEPLQGDRGGFRAASREASEVSELYSRSGHTPSVSSRSEGRSLDEPEEVDGRMAPEAPRGGPPRLGLSDKSSKESGSLSAPGRGLVENGRDGPVGVRFRRPRGRGVGEDEGVSGKTMGDP